ncbi:rod shape-determining protein MreD [Oceanomicrobium pacificus]|uniref:Rod shape-determining protein MreD n=1 Tax=Oceanomicrobium pacificus TaxID=2692916 RepID=A0A6B0TSD9_9RHOB|nr:rod shape-determining protein MreD [Oceanomicrobium pacificus]MXU64648.1 rod shape-determining protein MreD [Oceanomicrobium pacificus]
MATARSRKLVRTASVTALGIAALLVHSAPLGISADARALPDLLYLLLAAWILRRPDTAPLWLVALLGIGADVLLGGPMGLGAATLLLGTEFLRMQARTQADRPFALEWLMVALVYAAMLFGRYIALKLSFAPVSAMSVYLWHLVQTALVYPLMVLALRFGMRLRTPGAVGGPDRLGRVP